MRVLLADDQASVRFALHVTLKGLPALEITGEVSEAAELPAAIKAGKPDLLILDWLLPGLKKIGSIAALRELCPDLMVIAVSGRPELGQAALAGGANAFVSKIDAPDRLLEAVEACKNTFEAKSGLA